jgi:hypothetical protein
MSPTASQVKRVASNDTTNKGANELALNASKNLRRRFVITSLMAIAGVASMAGALLGYWRTYEGSLTFVTINDTLSTLHGLSITMIELKMNLAGRRRGRPRPARVSCSDTAGGTTSHPSR